MTQPVLRTSRLLLRALDARDDGTFWRLRTDPVVRQWLDGDPWPSVDRAREERLKIQAGIDAGKWCFWGLASGPNSPLLGTICLWNFNPERTECEVGFDLFSSRQGKGLMCEAAEAVLAWAWDQLPLTSIAALTHRDNQPARRFLEGQGFSVEPIPPSWEVTEAEASTQVFFRLHRPRS